MKKVTMNNNSWALKILCFRANGNLNTERWISECDNRRRLYDLPDDSCALYSKVITTLMMWTGLFVLVSFLTSGLGVTILEGAMGIELYGAYSIWLLLPVGALVGAAVIGGCVGGVFAIGYAVLRTVESKILRSLISKIKTTKPSQKLGGTFRQLREARKDKFCTEYEYEYRTEKQNQQ